MVTLYLKGGLSVYQGKDLRKDNGKKLARIHKKRKYEYGREPILTKISKKSEEVRYNVRTKFGNIKTKLKEALYANVYDPINKVFKKVKILDVVENPNDKNLNRNKIITKNTIIKTELGNAKVISRPGQDGVINAILLK